MKVCELIKKLQAFDPEITVVVGGFDEEGYADIDRIQMVSAVPRSDKVQTEIIGEYEDADRSEDKRNVIMVLHVDHR